MNISTIVGIVGGIVLVVGAAYPDRPNVRAITSAKDWLFAAGGLIMLAYSIMNYLAGGSVFFIFLQALVNLSSIFMMLETNDRIDTPVMIVATLGLIVWSLWILPDLSTIPFILGLSGIAIGYCSTGGTKRREVALILGSALVALFSYIEGNQIFFWLNVFFATFSGIQLFRMMRIKPSVNP